MGIRFNSASCIMALEQELIIAMSTLQNILYDESVQNMRTPEGKDSLYKEEVGHVAGFISALVVGGAYAAMDEFGKGSLMDASNPALADYMNSDLWNPHRKDTKIRSRARADGPYTNIFGETVTSKSNVGGIDLEAKRVIFEPQPPSHAMQTAGRWLQNGEFKRVIQQTISNFNFGRYFIVDTR